MSNIKNHKRFTKEKPVQSYLLPHVCFACRKSFKKPASDKLQKCSDCGNNLIPLNRKFKAPKKTAIEEWEVVKYLVNAGFFYQSIYLENGKTTNYPKTIKEAKEFVVAYKNMLH